jgi:hypothetical protein
MIEAIIRWYRTRLTGLLLQNRTPSPNKEGDLFFRRET